MSGKRGCWNWKREFLAYDYLGVLGILGLLGFLVFLVVLGFLGGLGFLVFQEKGEAQKQNLFREDNLIVSAEVHESEEAEEAIIVGIEIAIFERNMLGVP